MILDKEALDSNHKEKNNTFKTSATNAYEHSYLQHPSRHNGKHYFTTSRDLMSVSKCYNRYTLTFLIVEYKKETKYRQYESSRFDRENVVENRFDKKHSKKSADHEKSTLQLCHVQSRIDGNRKSLLLDHQPCQLSDLSCKDTYHIGKSVEDRDYTKEEILFDFEEEFYENCSNSHGKPKEVGIE